MDFVVLGYGGWGQVARTPHQRARGQRASADLRRAYNLRGSYKPSWGTSWKFNIISGKDLPHLLFQENKSHVVVAI